MEGVIQELIAAAIAALFIILMSRVWKFARKHLNKDADTLAGAEAQVRALASVVPPEWLSRELPVSRKVSELERQRDEASAEARDARARGGDAKEPTERSEQLQECLQSMAFLAEGDVVHDQYRLLSRIGGGRTSVVWKAYDNRQDRFVALKFLRHTYINDESLYRQFVYTARVMSELSARSFAAVRDDVRHIDVDGTRKLVYYALEYVEGEPLDVYAAAHPEERDKLVDGLLEVGNCLADAHAKGIVHRDLKPGGILVEPNGSLKLVDFDSVLRLGDRRISHRDAGTFGYSAPEVFDGEVDPDVRADIFALGRVFSYLYYGRSLPNAYALSVYDLIDLLHCGPSLKNSLERACAVSPEERYRTMTEFLRELRAAVRDGRERLRPVDTLRRDRGKIGTLLRHSFLGTLAAMMIARPLFAHFSAVQLSPDAIVGAFHGIIGSFVWGTLISGAFVVFLVFMEPRVKRPWGRYASSAAICGLGGFLGGALLSIPAVFVTHPNTLACLGWLTNAPDASRIDMALFDTRMMLAYPLTGTLTGIGLGLCLLRGIELALKANPEGSGLLPIPAKRESRIRTAGSGLLGPLLSSPQAHLFLGIPAIFSFLVAFALNAEAAQLACELQPNPQIRSLGEGIVHYFGALGLTIGFFRGVRGGSTSS